MQRTVDLNCDMGEGFGSYHLGDDAAIMPLVTSANIACGFHAGDPHVMRRTLRLTKQYGVGAGAHPGYPDLLGFGRRAMTLTPEEIYDVTLYQIGALWALARAEGIELTHVKIHGAMYNTAAKNAPQAEALAKAVRAVDKDLVFVGLAGSLMISAAEEAGLKAVHEVFADRGYMPDGSLVPRSHPQALHTNVDVAVKQVLQMVKTGTVTAITGETVPIQADSICLHGDGSHAVEFARAVRQALTQEAVEIRGFKRRA